MENILLEIKNLLQIKTEELSIKKLTNQVKTLYYYNYYANVLPKINNYYLTDKIEGIRSLILCKNSTLYIVNNELKEKKLDINLKETIIVDCEILDNKIFIFDVLYFNENLTYKSYTTRMRCLNDNKQKISSIGQIKNIVKIKDNRHYCDTVNKFLKDNKNPIDGLILMLDSEEENYITMTNYKWKHLNTIDFLVKKDNSKNKDKYILFSSIDKRLEDKLQITRKFTDLVKITDNSTNPIQFSPINYSKAYEFSYSGKEEIENKICELYYKNDKWHLLKIREDREYDKDKLNYSGNYFKIAEFIWYSYNLPIEQDKLCLPQSLGYFEKSDDKFKIVRQFNNSLKLYLIKFITTKLMEKDFAEDIKNNKLTVFDLAAGKGQDIFKLVDKYYKLHFIEYDKIAISQLIDRRYSVKSSNKIFVHNLNLLEDYSKNIKKMHDNIEEFEENSGHLITINFAFHYFVENKKTIENMINYINKLIKKNGFILITCFNGKTIEKKLKDNVWKTDKYYIKKINKNEIELLLPCKNEKYTEYLVNISDIITQFNSAGYVRIMNKSFINFDRTRNFNELSSEDKEFIELYDMLIFKKL